MDLLFLGTSSGVPTKTRNVTGLAVIAAQGSHWYLVDCGEATQHQIQHTPLSIHKLQAIFITHAHGDHCYGLPGLLASAAMTGRKQALPLIAPRAVHAMLKEIIHYSQLHLPFTLQALVMEEFTGWQDQQVQLQAIPLSHRLPSWACSFTEISAPTLDVKKLQAAAIPPGPLWGQLQRGENVAYQGRQLLASDYLQSSETPRKIVVGGDNDQPNLLRAACQNAQVLVHEATYTQEIWDKVGPQVQHSSAAQVAAFAQEIALPHLVLTHFSPRYQDNPHAPASIIQIADEASRHYQGGLCLAQDFAHFRLHKDGSFTRLAEGDS